MEREEVCQIRDCSMFKLDYWMNPKEVFQLLFASSAKQEREIDS